MIDTLYERDMRVPPAVAAEPIVPNAQLQCAALEAWEDEGGVSGEPAVHDAASTAAADQAAFDEEQAGYRALRVL